MPRSVRPGRALAAVRFDWTFNRGHPQCGARLVVDGARSGKLEEREGTIAGIKRLLLAFCSEQDERVVMPCPRAAFRVVAEVPLVGRYCLIYLAPSCIIHGQAIIGRALDDRRRRKLQHPKQGSL